MSYQTFQSELNQVLSQSGSLGEMQLEQVLDTIPRIDQLENLKPGSTILIRTDLDVPIKAGYVSDMSRIASSSRTIKYASEKGLKTILFGHLGRDGTASLAPVCEAMSQHIGRDIQLLTDWLEPGETELCETVVAEIHAARAGAIYMLENTRKYEIERALWDLPEEDYAEVFPMLFSLAENIRQRLTDCFINESIAASNLDFSSSVLPLVMKNTAMGFFIYEEMQEHLIAARRSDFLVMSGAKADKLNELEAILERGQVKLLIVAGALAIALKKADAQSRGAEFSTGLAETDPGYKGYLEPRRIQQAHRIIRKCHRFEVELLLPSDFILDSGVTVDKIPPNHAQLDIGPLSIERFKDRVVKYIADSRGRRSGSTLFYNGVFGMFEKKEFENGTHSFILLLKDLTDAGISTYVGGGEGRLALTRFGSLLDVTHAFTCGGTILKSLTNRHIGYLKALYLQNIRRKEIEPEDLGSLIRRFRAAHTLDEIEYLADRLGGTTRPEAIEPLVLRLADAQVQENPDVEDAVCSALVRLGVMDQRGDLNFRLLPSDLLTPAARALLEKYQQRTPLKYSREW